MLFSLYIINKAGGLVYQQDLSPLAPKLSSNDHLRLGSTFHSMHAIAALAAPTNSGGIDSLETSTFRLQCLQTLTGIKFFITAALVYNIVLLEPILRVGDANPLQSLQHQSQSIY
ncbi:uncharacterized protein CCR75_007909 [Bremia lactucae]|uniref:Trafficking protein particle complex subunit n=1 Tax=Bremia lactucae TaxID=4779 RepID=A0A976IKC2_BRELC|nr:hypothetical protein CCR75_007909 [Bremia lactucae]